MTRSLALALIATGLSAGTASAAPIYFSDPVAFAAAAGSLGFESFETTPTTGFVNGLVVNTPGFTLTSTRAGVLGAPNGLSVATDGVQFVAVSAAANPNVTTFTFPTAITAFAVDITDPAESGNLTATVGGNPPTVAVAAPLPNGSQAFFGVIDTAGFTTVTLTGQTGDSFGLDAVQFGDAAQTEPVPEPATLGVLGLLAGVGGLVARRRKTAA